MNSITKVPTSETRVIDPDEASAWEFWDALTDDEQRVIILRVKSIAKTEHFYAEVAAQVAKRVEDHAIVDMADAQIATFIRNGSMKRLLDREIEKWVGEELAIAMGRHDAAIKGVIVRAIKARLRTVKKDVASVVDATVVRLREKILRSVAP